MAKVEGVALHSGANVTVHLHRDAGPLRFRRQGVEIEACVANLAGSDRATTLAAGGARVGLVEHLLAALRIAGYFGGVIVEVDGEELPILDGSAAAWTDAISALPPPDEPPAPLLLSRELTVEARGGSLATLTPGPEALECVIDFAHPAIGRQSWSGGPPDYRQLLDARTFGFMNEVEQLRSRGLARGGGLEHAIVFDDEGPVRPLRSADEPVRHKALDAIGDLSLLGRPLGGSLRIERGSHALHHQLMRRLTEAREEGAVARS